MFIFNLTKIIDHCQLKHLKNLWIILMVKKMLFNYKNDQVKTNESIFYLFFLKVYNINYLLLKMPFENLSNDFKASNTEVSHVEVFANSNPVAALSLCVILFQIIEFLLMKLTEEERATQIETKYHFFSNFN